MSGKIRISQYILLILLLSLLTVYLFTGSWKYTTSGELYVSLEMSSSLLAYLAGISSALFFYSSGSPFYLVIGLGFFISGSEDIVHGLMGLKSILAGHHDESLLHLSGSILGDDLIFSLTLIAAYLASSSKPIVKDKRKLFLLALGASILIMILITMAAILLSLFRILNPVGLFSSPVDLVTAVFFLLALGIALGKSGKYSDLFRHFLIFFIIFNFFGYLIMSFSRISHDVFFDVSQIITTISLLFPILGYLLLILEQQKDLMEKEKEISESRNQISTILEASPDTIFIVDYSMNIVRENHRDFSDYNDYEGRPVLSIIPEPDREKYKKAFRNAAVKGKMEKIEIEEKSGESTYTTLIRLIPYSEGTRGKYIIHQSTDITELVKQKQALQASEERYNLAMSVANDGVWDWDISNDRSHFDSRYYIMLGYEPGEFPSAEKEWQSRIHPDDLAGVVNALNEYIQGFSGSYEKEYRFRMKSGEYKWVKSKGKIISRDSDNKPERILGTLSDISKRKKAEEELNRTLTELRQMNEIMTGREYRILEMKGEVNSLLRELNLQEKYKVTDNGH